jgi:hypothetical protein
MVMDFHLDTLLNLPQVTVFTCQQQEGFIILKLELLNPGINCPHCQTYTDNLHQTRPILYEIRVYSKRIQQAIASNTDRCQGESQ